MQARIEVHSIRKTTRRMHLQDGIAADAKQGNFAKNTWFVGEITF